MDQDQVVSRFVKKVVGKFKPQAILLFGSRARGDQLLHSDYDFIIISESFQNVPWLDRISAVVQLWTADENVDVIPYTPDEFSDKRIDASIIRSAMKEAQLVYGKLEAAKTRQVA